MATNLLPPFNPSLSCTVDRSCPDHYARKSSTNWWTPLFGWSSEPDYLDSSCSSGEKIPRLDGTEAETGTKKSSRLRPVQFTEEKARLLRMMTTDAGSFHHEMYHSAIASRLASDFGDRSDFLG